MAFFNYRFSPFYTSLPNNSADRLDADLVPPSRAASDVNASEDPAARWLRQRRVQPSNKAQQQLDAGRRAFLQELYDEARPTEKLRRGRKLLWRGVEG